jgi:flavin reductase (DIM6/NTAB) family NADH-FMN oxidoreductase RutF
VTVIDPRALAKRDAGELVNGLVAPRPIAWISTLDGDGRRNLAPFSFFNAFSAAPFTIGVGPGSRDGVHKDSLRNIKASGEFAVSLVSEDLAEHANRTSADFGPDVDEWEVTGLTAAPCLEIAPPRVGEAPASLECQVFEIVDLGPPDLATNSLVIARVLQVHLDDQALDGIRPRPEVLRLVGRMGGQLWCRTSDQFALERPSPEEALAASNELTSR